MAPTYSMDRTILYRAFSCQNRPSKMSNRRFDVINRIRADGIGADGIGRWFANVTLNAALVNNVNGD